MSSGPSHDHETTGSSGRPGGVIARLARLKPRRGSAVPWAALAGLLSAGAAVSVGELISGITDRTPSLVLGVSDAIVDSRFVPGGVVRWSIDTFGSAQKPLLVLRRAGGNACPGCAHRHRGPTAPLGDRRRLRRLRNDRRPRGGRQRHRHNRHGSADRCAGGAGRRRVAVGDAAPDLPGRRRGPGRPEHGRHEAAPSRTPT